MIPYMVIGSFDSCTIVHVVYFDEQIFAELNRYKIVKFIELDFIKKHLIFLCGIQVRRPRTKSRQILSHYNC